jgi:hypothetical protein
MKAERDGERLFMKVRKGEKAYAVQRAKKLIVVCDSHV